MASRRRRFGQRNNVRMILKQLEEDFSKNVTDEVKQELETQSNNIANAAKSLCPVKTGKLRDSIHVEVKGNGTRYDIVADAKDDKGRMYGRVVEFRPDAPRPFMLPAYDANYKAAYDAILARINSAINKTNNSNP